MLWSVLIAASGLAQVTADFRESPEHRAAASCVADELVRGRTLTASVARHCAAVSGVYDALLLPIAIADANATSTADSLADFVTQEAKPRHATHVGLARREGSPPLTVAFFSQRIGEFEVDLAPVHAGDSIVFHGGVSSDYEAPHALLTTPDGQVRDVHMMVVGKGDYIGQARLPHIAGRYQVEVVVWSRTKGAAVLANRAFFVDVAATAPPLAVPTAVSDPRLRMLALMNEARLAHGAPPLALDVGLERVAVAHAEDMRDHNYFGHDSAERNVTMRVQDAGVAFEKLAENLAEAATPEDAHATLMASPGHRRNILNPELQRVGIGMIPSQLSTGDALWIVVVDFAGS